MKSEFVKNFTNFSCAENRPSLIICPVGAEILIFEVVPNLKN